MSDLNSNFTVPDEAVLASVKPEAGSCLLFYAPGILHDGQCVRGQPGTKKHILRTDVMYERVPGTQVQLTPTQVEAREVLKLAGAAEESKDFDTARLMYKRAFRLDPDLEWCV